MKSLIKYLKPYKLWLLLIILCHILRAYTTLLLPNYTSELIDTGIQHSGFERAVSPVISDSDYEKLSKMLLKEELKVLNESYEKKEEGYHIKESVQDSPKQLSKLEESLKKAQAMLMMASQQNQDKQKEVEIMLQMMTPEQWRPMIEKEFNNIDDKMVNASAKSYVKTIYENAGENLGKYQFTYLKKQGMTMLAITGVSILIAMLAHYLSARIGADVGYHLREKTFSKVLAFSQEELNHFSTASLITRSTNDIQQIQMMLTIILRLTLFAPAMAIGGVYHVLQTGTNLSWIILFAVITVIAIMGALLLITMPKFKLLQKQVDKLNLISREILTGLQVIRGFNRQETENARFQISNEELMNTQLFVNRVMSLMMPLMMLIMNVVSIIIVWYSGQEISQGNIQVGQMTAFIQYAMQIIFSFLLFSMMAVMLPRAMVSADRIQEVLDTPLVIHNPSKAKVIADRKGHIQFNNVSYHFKGATTPAVEDLSFQAIPGQTTAIIGSTGSGKSTILNLLMRYYDVSQGEILIDGIDIRELSIKALREMIGYVPQKGVLFSGTIASNIKYADVQISDEDMEKAAKIANAEDFIFDKPEKFNAAISQGGMNISGGQKQRLAISRAIASDPQIYLFDDSFSALDYRTDSAVRKELSAVTEDKTVIIVAQRVSTILNADNIIVLDEGKIVGQGTHKKLYKHNQVYQEIAQSQLSKEELDHSINKRPGGGNHHV